MKATLMTLVLLGVAGGGWVYYAQRPTADTVAIKQGDLLSTIGATGTVEPEEVVDVGAQVMGSILEFGPDPHSPTKLIDYGSVVKKGSVLATIDPTPYEAALAQAEAALERSKADMLQLEAKHEQAEQEWKRAQADSSSGWRLLVPWSIARRCYSPTSRRATSIHTPASKFYACSSNSTPRGSPSCW